MYCGSNGRDTLLARKMNTETGGEIAFQLFQLPRRRLYSVFHVQGPRGCSWGSFQGVNATLIGETLSRNVLPPFEKIRVCVRVRFPAKHA